jgi:hypothetical protein
LKFVNGWFGPDHVSLGVNVAAPSLALRRRTLFNRIFAGGPMPILPGNARGWP